MKKKFFALALAVLSFCLMLVACGNEDEKENDTKNQLEYELSADGSHYTVVGIGHYESRDTVTIPSTFEGKPVKAIGNEAFQGIEIKGVVIPDSVVSIGDYAFLGTDITTVTIGNGVESIGRQAFSGCPITSIIIPDSVKSIGINAFDNCHELESAVIGKSVETIGETAFGACFKLTEVYNLSSLEITAGSSENGYVGSYALNVFTSLDDESKRVETEDGFCFCEKDGAYYLVDYKGSSTDIVLPNDYEGNKYEINKYAFYGSELTSAVISNAVSVIGEGAFAQCDSLASIEISDTVTNIGVQAFEGCDSITEIIIPESVRFIEKGAISYCSKLERIVFESPSGWNLSYNANYTNTVGAVDVTSPENNVTLFDDTYQHYYWFRD